MTAFPRTHQALKHSHADLELALKMARRINSAPNAAAIIMQLDPLECQVRDALHSINVARQTCHAEAREKMEEVR